MADRVEVPYLNLANQLDYPTVQKRPLKTLTLLVRFPTEQRRRRLGWRLTLTRWGSQSFRSSGSVSGLVRFKLSPPSRPLTHCGMAVRDEQDRF